MTKVKSSHTMYVIKKGEEFLAVGEPGYYWVQKAAWACWYHSDLAARIMAKKHGGEVITVTFEV